MSIARCTRHEVTYDTDFLECCPDCDAEPDLTFVERRPGGYAVRLATAHPDCHTTIWGIGYTRDQAVSNLMERR